jgi:phenylacetate-CoA ligase
MLNLNQLKKYYTNSPLWMKRLYGAIPFDIRSGAEYRKWREFLEREVSGEEYELIKLKETIAYAYETSPYYSQLFKSLDASPNDINDRKDLLLLPTIDKSTIRNNYEKFIAKGFSSRKSFYVTTGGTSGTPMKFLQSKNVWSKEVAFIMNFYARSGLKSNMIKASFRGGDFDGLVNNVFWKFNPHANEIHFSPFHINLNTVSFYVDELNRREIKFFHTYPSSIKLLIENMKKMNLKLSYSLDTIFLISENILEDDVKLIQSFFACEVSSFFGHSERLIFAPSKSSDLSSFKVDRRYGLFELVNNHGDMIQENHTIGEMVGTSFDNYAMPLIRYRTNDKTSYLDKNELILNKIEGRWKQEYLLGKDTTKLYLTALNMHSDIFKSVIKYQFRQHSYGKASICLQVKEDFTKEDEKAILSALNQKANKMIDFKIEFVDSFKLTHRGKFINIIRDF